MKFSPGVSVILPVRNEETLIAPAIEYIRQTSSGYPVEIIIVDGQSVDKTPQISRPLVDCLIEADRAGRGYQMHLGAQKATRQFLLFLHVDTRLPENWQELIRKSFIKPVPPAALTFSLRFDSSKIFYYLLATLANWRTKITGVPHGDQSLAISRETYFACGGFPDAPLMEEYLFARNIRSLGRLEVLKEPVVTSCRKYERKGPFVNAFKNSLLVILFYLGVSPKRLASWY